MKFLPLILPLAAGAMVFLSSCTAPVVKRIERNPQIYNALSERHKGMVAQRKIEEGMTKGAVFIAWGRPDRVSKGTRAGKTYDRWTYVGFDTVPAYGSGLGYGYAGGLYGHRYIYDPLFYYEPIAQVPYEAGRVEFVNGKVSAWSVAQ
jgi:hypothetical protein